MAKRQTQVTIVGLGLIGTSLGLALKATQADLLIVGHDRELDAAKRAAKLGAIDRSEWNLINAVDDADIIFLAIPVAAIRDTLEAIADDVKPGVLITDTASSKVQVLEWADAILPDHVNFVGGDPIVRRVGQGQADASADLFQESVYCLVPALNADEDAMHALLRLVSALGAEYYFVDAAEHDGLVAAVSQLPLVVSAAVVRALAASRSEKDLQRMAAGAWEFRAITRFAATDPIVAGDACATNSENMVRWIDALIAELATLRDMVGTGTVEELEELFEDVFVTRARWVGVTEEPSAMQSSLDEVGGGLRQALFGNLGRSRD